MTGGIARRSELRHSVTLQREMPSTDAGGGHALVWTDVARLRAAIEPLRGGERLAAGQVEAAVTHRVTLRYRSGVTAAMRLLVRGRPLQIRAVVNRGERNRWLDLLCEEGVAT